MRITPVNSLNFNGEEKNADKKKYKDPLMQWPARGLAYTNELGAAISDIAPRMGTLLWFPAMLYFGADIYDKYKNEKTAYSPDTGRGTEQAIFQLLASVILPTASVIAGQKTASALGSLGKSGLSLQSREEIIHFLQEFTSRRHLDKYDKEKLPAFKEHFQNSLEIKRDKLIKENKIKSPLAFIRDAIFSRRHPESIAMSHKDKVLNFADQNIDEMFDMFTNLMNNQKPKQFSEKIWKNFGKLKEKYSKDPDYQKTYIRDAAEDVIKHYQKNKIMQNKMLKTIGGFAALGFAIKPIDKFVENVIIKKVVQPNIDTVFARSDGNKDKDKFLK